METAEIIYAIKTTSTRGDGTSASPSRVITQYWTLGGELLFEKDPLLSGNITGENLSDFVDAMKSPAKHLSV